MATLYAACRLHVTGQTGHYNGNEYFVLHEFELYLSWPATRIVPTAVTDGAGNSEDSAGGNSGRGPAKAMDGLVATDWCCDPLPVTLIVSFEQPCPVVAYELFTGNRPGRAVGQMQPLHGGLAAPALGGLTNATVQTQTRTLEPPSAA